MIRTRVFLPYGQTQCYIYQVKKDLNLYDVTEAPDPEFDMDLRRFYLNTDYGAMGLRIAVLEAQLAHHINPVLSEEEQAYRDFAMANLASDDLEFDENAKVSLGDDDGAFVECWQWVPRYKAFPEEDE